MNEIKLVDGRNVHHVTENWEAFNQAVNDFNNGHQSVQMLLSEEDHVDWCEPRILNFKCFVKEVEVWKREQIAHQGLILPQDSISNMS